MNGRYRLGIDLGTNSLGWAMLTLNDTDRPVGIYRMGVRIFPNGRDPKTEVSLASARTSARGQRVRRERFLKRRSALLAKLVALGLFPAEQAAGRKLATLDPYELRTKALTEKIHPWHLGRALLHLARRRGFKSNRKDANSDEAKVTGPAIERLSEQLTKTGAATLGQLLYQRLEAGQPARFRPDAKSNYDLYPIRAFYEQEFAAIQTGQSQYHPTVAPADWEALRDIIFEQRPLKPQEKGRCRFLKDPSGKPLPRAPLAYPSFQEFRILSDANHLAYCEDPLSDYQSLNPSQRLIVLALLRSQKSVTFGKVRSKLGLPETARFNVESDRRNALAGDSVSALLSGDKYFGARWRELSFDQRDAIVGRLLDEGTNEADLKHAALTDWGLDEECAARVAALGPQDFPRGMAPFSSEFARLLVPRMAEGLRYSAAVEALGFKHALAGEDGTAPCLPYYGRAMPEAMVAAPRSSVPDERDFGRIANPTVHIALNQLRLVVNTLINRYGKPAQITVELARSLKLTAKQRSDLESEQLKNKRTNDGYRSELTALGVEDNYENRLRLRLWHELSDDVNDRCCIYSGTRIAQARLFSDAVEIDHILPFAATLDDSPANKVLCLREANRAKRKRSPYEAFNHDPAVDYRAVLDRAESLPANKRWRFRADAMDQFRRDNGFLRRQLTDTQYLAKVARRYLTTIATDVRVFPGRLTALLRHHWGLDTILADPESDRVAKNRADHRHHAIDALVVALADQAALVRIQQANEADRIQSIAAPLPWPSLRSDAAAATVNIVVSHRPDHNPAGRLHEETAYGPVRSTGRRPSQDWEHREGFNLVVRKPLIGLKAGELSTVRDMTLQARLRNHLDGIPDTDKTAWAAALHDFGVRTGVRTVRLLKIDGSARQVVGKNGSGVKWIIPGHVHSVTFWRLRDGKVEIHPVLVLDGNNPKFIPTRPKDPIARKLYTVHKGDLLRTVHRGETKTIRVKGINPSPTNFNLVCVPHNAANDNNKFTIQLGRVLKTQTRLLHVDPIGNVQDPGPLQ
jgi:CRISPR-associated endonuclease Csn1